MRSYSKLIYISNSNMLSVNIVSNNKNYLLELITRYKIWVRKMGENNFVSKKFFGFEYFRSVEILNPFR